MIIVCIMYLRFVYLYFYFIVHNNDYLLFIFIKKKKKRNSITNNKENLFSFHHFFLDAPKILHTDKPIDFNFRQRNSPQMLVSTHLTLDTINGKRKEKNDELSLSIM